MKRNTISLFAIALLLAITGGWHSASKNVPQDLRFQDEFDLLDGAADKPITVSAWYRLQEGSREGNLFVQAVMGDGYHCYSQKHKGAEVPSSFKVSATDQFEIKGGFEPDVDPHVYEKDGEHREEFEEEVTWSAPIKLAEGVEPASLEINVTYTGMVCNATGCRPPMKKPLVAQFDGYEAAPQANSKFRPTMSHVLFLATLQRVDGAGAIQPGDKLTLDITAEPEGEYHIYPYQATKSEDQEDFPTLIAFTRRNGWSIKGPTISVVPEEKTVGDTKVVYHHNPVTFSYEIEIPSDAEAKTYALHGAIGFQTCTDIGCDRYDAVEFTVDVPVSGDVTGVMPVSFTGGAKYKDVQAAASQFAAAGQKSAGQWEGMTLPVVLPLAFLAGLILNIMPCVLPVIGLKIMSFVQQAGENPFRVFMLNLVFALGMIFVFLILATLAVFFGYGWGELYESLLFKTIMIGVVFVFGLSFFGVWEIPLPGFVGSGAASKAAEKEGMAGAFLKGVLTTLLATPCSGPLLIPAVVWAIAQPPLVTYLVFLALGLGMASPFLVIGAMPKLAGFLPKPGNWMITFKQLMGFVLMATCVFFLGSVGNKYTIPVLSLLCFLGLACWWVGRTSLAAKFGDKAKAWTYAAIIGAFGVWFSFFFLLPQHELDYLPYSRVALEQSLEEGATVFVDFTADW